jgi:hypothetical protein
MALTLSNMTGLNLHVYSTKNTVSELRNEPESINGNDDDANDDNDCCNSKPCTSRSVNDDIEHVPKIKKSKLSNDKADDKTTSSCYCEVRRWKHGYYTLITDVDAELQVNCLDTMMFFNCTEAYNEDCGGNISYIAKDEDDEVCIFL